MSRTSRQAMFKNKFFLRYINEICWIKRLQIIKSNQEDDKQINKGLRDICNCLQSTTISCLKFEIFYFQKNGY